MYPVSQRYYLVKYLIASICMCVLNLIKYIYDCGLHSKRLRCIVLEAFLKEGPALKPFDLYRLKIFTWPHTLEIKKSICFQPFLLLLSAGCIQALC